MSDLNDLEAVLTVARLRSFRAAAGAMGMSTSSLSHAVAALEARLGVRLFNRTTRSVALTEAGETFIASVAPALAAIRGAMDEAGSRQQAPTGTLRINTSAGAAQRCMPLFIEFMRRYPDMKLDVVTEGRLIDIVADGFDAGIRLAETVPQDMIAVGLGAPIEFIVVGSPALLERYGPVTVPADLLRQPCVRMRMPSGAVYRWEFLRHGEASELDVKGPFTLDQAANTLAAARAGFGWAYMDRWYVAADLAAGTLVEVLQGWTAPVSGLALYYPGRRHVPPGLRALIELARETATPR